ncbi:MAG: DUF6544 family protein, partial [Chloroflexota bacterium]
VAAEKEALRLSAADPGRPFTYADLAGLPDPVQRCLRYSLAEGTPRVRVARIRQGGTFRSEFTRPWMNIAAEQIFTVDPPGFVWNARLKVNPLVWIDGRDKYVEGAANMLIKPFALFPVVDATGPEMDISSLIRYLSEMFWFPTSLLPGKYLRWEPIDDHSARAIIADRGLEAAGVFTFDDEGRVTRFETDQRYREENGRYIRQPWVATAMEYREVAPGIKVPSGGEVSWVLPDEGLFPYGRLYLTEVAYE